MSFCRNEHILNRTLVFQIEEVMTNMYNVMSMVVMNTVLHEQLHVLTENYTEGNFAYTICLLKQRK